MKATKTYNIDGMHCASCAMLIEGELEDRGIEAKCSYAKATVEVDIDTAAVSDEVIAEAVEAAGYRLKNRE